jgi:hypothetical protein
VPAAGVVGEAMVMLTLADFVLDKFGGDSMTETHANFEAYRARISRSPEPPLAGGQRRARTPAATSAGEPAPWSEAASGGEAGSGGDD